MHGSSSAIASIGTSLTGIMYLMMPATFTLLTRYPWMRRWCGPVGLAIMAASFLLSSFATQVWQLIVLQGVLSAIGSGLLFSPTTLYMDEWFIARKGFAYGMMWAGKSVAGVAAPFIMNALLSAYGSRTTIRVWTVTLLVITTPILFFLKPRIPVSISSAPRPLSWSFLRHPTFWTLQAGNIIQSFGYFLPNTYIASYAHTLGLPSITGTLLIALVNFTSVFGGIVIGCLGDRFAVTSIIFISSFGSTVAVLLLWGLSSHITLLILFALIYGFFAGGFSSTWPGILQELKREEEGVDTGLIMGLLLGGRGIGNVISGPLSSALLSEGGFGGRNWGYGTEYGGMILFTGLTALFGGWGWMWKTIRQISH